LGFVPDEKSKAEKCTCLLSFCHLLLRNTTTI
jgi:hypothetical protein